MSKKVLIDLSRVEQKVITIPEFFEIKSQMNTREDKKIPMNIFQVQIIIFSCDDDWCLAVSIR